MWVSAGCDWREVWPLSLSLGSKGRRGLFWVWQLYSRSARCNRPAQISYWSSRYRVWGQRTLTQILHYSCQVESCTALQAGSLRVQFPIMSLEIFIDIILPARVWPWNLTQPLTEKSTRFIDWRVKVAVAYGWEPHQLHVPFLLKSGSLNLLEPLGPIQACTGIALPFPDATPVFFFISRAHG